MSCVTNRGFAGARGKNACWPVARTSWLGQICGLSLCRFCTNDIGFATHPTLDFGPISNPDEGEPVLGSRAAPSFPFQLRRGFNLTAYAKPPRRIKGSRGVSGWGVGGAAGCCRRQDGVAGEMMERVGCSGLGGLGAREPACREPREPESRMLSRHHWQALAMVGIVIRFLIADGRPIDVNSIKKLHQQTCRRDDKGKLRALNPGHSLLPWPMSPPT